MNIRLHDLIVDLSYYGSEIRGNPAKFSELIFINHIGKYMELVSYLLRQIENKEELDIEYIKEYKDEKQRMTNILKRML